MIIATAGHVDHGKTSLVRQLTHVETDTLAEEQERGLSINLGYAYLPHPGATPLGFIDVPGHQRFINTMISGISAIDMGLLVIAADDGVMPQTVEHLDVLEILGVGELTVVLSKIDRASPPRQKEVEAQIHDLLATRRWRNTPCFAVSNLDGQGIGALKDRLLERALQLPDRQADGGFRLSIDRSFTAKGAGLVVTGTASAGTVNANDRLLLLPSHKEVRVRTLRAHDENVISATAGQRVALNLAGKVDVADINKGDWLVDPDYALISSRLDVDFSLLASAPFPLKHLAPVKLYIGAKRVAGKLALVDSPARKLHPGDHCLAQLILDSPVSTIFGERFLLRDHAENVILGGGTVLDPDGPKFGKSRSGRLVWLQAMLAPSAAKSLTQLLENGQLVELNRFWANRNRPVPTGDNSLPRDARQFESEGKQWAIHQTRWAAAAQYLTQCVAAWHQAHPEQAGIKATDLKPATAQHFESPLAMAVLVSVLQRGDLILRDGHISSKGFKKLESPQAQDHWKALKLHLRQCRHQIPLLSELIAATRIPESDLRKVIKDAIRTGELHRLNDRRFALPEQLLHFSERVVEAQTRGEELSIIKLKANFNSGRNLTIEIMEYFDSIHFTRRKGDTRIVLNPSAVRDRFGTKQ